MKTRSTRRTLRVGIAVAAWTGFLAYMAAQPQVARATFAGSNGRISFARYDLANKSTSIWSVRADLSDQQQLTFDNPNCTSLVSNWSPDGSRIAFDSDRNSFDVNLNACTDSVVDIFTVKADGTGTPVQLTSNAGFNGEPNYSPDGTTIVFDSDRGRGAEGLYLMNASDGSNIRRVTVAPMGFIDIFPQFSPAGDRIAFTRSNSCTTRRGVGPSRAAGCLAAVFVVNPNGSGLTQITGWGLDTAVTDWSPDGKKLLWQSTEDPLKGSTVDIQLVNVDGSHLVDLTNNTPIAQPCSISPTTVSDLGKFSPDGKTIIFRQTTDVCTGQPTLWTVNPDGSNKQSTGIGLGGTFFGPASGFPNWGTNQK